MKHRRKMISAFFTITFSLVVLLAGQWKTNADAATDFFTTSSNVKVENKLKNFALQFKKTNTYGSPIGGAYFEFIELEPDDPTASWGGTPLHVKTNSDGSSNRIVIKSGSDGIIKFDKTYPYTSHRNLGAGSWFEHELFDFDKNGDLDFDDPGEIDLSLTQGVTQTATSKDVLLAEDEEKADCFLYAVNGGIPSVATTKVSTPLSVYDNNGATVVKYYAVHEVWAPISLTTIHGKFARYTPDPNMYVFRITEGDGKQSLSSIKIDGKGRPDINGIPGELNYNLVSIDGLNILDEFEVNNKYNLGTFRNEMKAGWDLSVEKIDGDSRKHFIGVHGIEFNIAKLQDADLTQLQADYPLTTDNTIPASSKYKLKTPNVSTISLLDGKIHLTNLSADDAYVVYEKTPPSGYILNEKAYLFIYKVDAGHQANEQHPPGVILAWEGHIEKATDTTDPNNIKTYDVFVPDNLKPLTPSPTGLFKVQTNDVDPSDSSKGTYQKGEIIIENYHIGILPDTGTSFFKPIYIVFIGLAIVAIGGAAYMILHKLDEKRHRYRHL